MADDANLHISVTGDGFSKTQRALVDLGDSAEATEKQIEAFANSLIANNKDLIADVAMTRQAWSSYVKDAKSHANIVIAEQRRIHDAMSATEARNRELARVWESGEKSKTLATKSYADAVRTEQKRIYDAMLAEESARQTNASNVIAAQREAVTAQNAASASIISAKRNESNQTISDIRRQIAAEQQALANKLNAAAKSGTVSAQFIAQSKLETSQRISDLQRQIAAQTQSTTKTSSAISSVITKLGAYAAAWVGVHQAVRLAQTTIETAAKYQTLERQLEFLTGNAKSAAVELEYLTNVSNKYGTVMLQSTESYGALSSAMRMSGLQLSQIHTLYEGLSAVSATYALSQDKVNQIMLAFTQIAGKGRVQSEELVRQLGQYIPALQIGAQAMGMSIREFNAALKEGSVASADFLPKMAALLNEIYGKDLERKTDTITAAQNRFSTALSETLYAISEQTGVAAAYKGVLKELADQMNRISRGGITAFDDMGQSVTNALDIIKESAIDTDGQLNKMAIFGGGNAALPPSSSVDSGTGDVSSMTSRQIDSLKAYLSTLSTKEIGDFQAATITAFQSIEEPTDSMIQKWNQLRAIMHDALGKGVYNDAKAAADAIDKATAASITLYDELYSKWKEDTKSDREKAIPDWVTGGIESTKQALASASDMLELRPTQAAQESYDEAKRAYDMALLLQAAYYDKYDTKTQTEAQNYLDSLTERFTTEEGRINRYYDKQIQKAKEFAESSPEEYQKMLDAIGALREKDLGDYKAKLRDKTTALRQELDQQIVEEYRAAEESARARAYAPQDYSTGGAITAIAQGGGILSAAGVIDAVGRTQSEHEQILALNSAYAATHAEMLDAQAQEDYDRARNLSEKLADIERQKADVDKNGYQQREEVAAQFQDNLLYLAQNGSKEALAIYKAAAIAQTIWSTYEGAQKAYSAMAGIPYVGPALGIAAAGVAVAAGLARVQAISSTSYATGGYTGDGGKYKPAGVVHAGEYVWTQEDVRAAGGPSAMERLREMYGAGSGKAYAWNGTGYATGGLVREAPVSSQASGGFGGINMIINNNAGTKLTTRQNADGGIQLDIDYIDAELARRQSFGHSKFGQVQASQRS